ncbi:hypothetical protein DSO57_1022904 [Entomophthora muscae]|uniref:Uncharacterized protein n=1 Tax=Entomophthora muscae TaxID=34485 RepID=A0ACC2U1K3_9FUNG|nr:hypothetical protein DSO57_1022904 [Entomophthora muscae]
MTPPDQYEMDTEWTVFCHLGVLFSREGMALPENEAKIFANLVNRMGKWRHKLLNMESHIQALNKVESLTCSFLWGKATAAPIKLSYLQAPKKSGGMGLLNVADKARQIWSKGFLVAIEATKLSLALGRATNWISSMKTKSPITANSLRIWILTHPGLQANRDSKAFWKELWRATKRSQWSVKSATPSESLSDKIKQLETKLAASTEPDIQNRIRTEILIRSYPTFWHNIQTDSKNFETVQKQNSPM